MPRVNNEALLLRTIELAIFQEHEFNTFLPSGPKMVPYLSR